MSAQRQPDPIDFQAAAPLVTNSIVAATTMMGLPVLAINTLAHTLSNWAIHKTVAELSISPHQGGRQRRLVATTATNKRSFYPTLNSS
jgi:hypothetical protein